MSWVGVTKPRKISDDLLNESLLLFEALRRSDVYLPFATKVDDLVRRIRDRSRDWVEVTHEILGYHGHYAGGGIEFPDGRVHGGLGFSLTKGDLGKRIYRVLDDAGVAWNLQIESDDQFERRKAKETI